MTKAQLQRILDATVNPASGENTYNIAYFMLKGDSNQYYSRQNEKIILSDKYLEIRRKDSSKPSILIPITQINGVSIV